MLSHLGLNPFQSSLEQVHQADHIADLYIILYGKWGKVSRIKPNTLAVASSMECRDSEIYTKTHFLNNEILESKLEFNFELVLVVFKFILKY